MSKIMVGWGYYFQEKMFGELKLKKIDKDDSRGDLKKPSSNYNYSRNEDFMVKRTVLLILLTILLVGCNFPLYKDRNFDSKTATAQMALTLTAASAITPSVTPDTSLAGMCSYNWATQSLPNESVLLQNALQTAGVAFISVRAEAFGENCYDATSRGAVSFSTMETDFHVSVPVESLDNKEEMGNVAFTIIKTILDFPQGTFPGPNPGYIGINYKSETSELNLWFQISFIKDDVANGMKGTELFDKLNS